MKIRILTESDTALNREWWGDYWVKLELIKAFNLNQVEVEIVNENSDVDLFFHAQKEDPRLTAPIRFAWVYTRLETALKQIEYFKQFSHVFCLSQVGVSDFNKQGVSASYLPAGTSMRPYNLSLQKDIDILFVGNAYKKNRPPLIKNIIKAGYNVHLYGTGWDKIKDLDIKNSWKGNYWPNQQMPELYNKAKIILTIHEPEMLQSKSLSIRTLDILASGNFCLCDNIEVKRYCPHAIVYSSEQELFERIEFFQNMERREEIINKTTSEAQSHTYAKIVNIILSKIREIDENFIL